MPFKVQKWTRKKRIIGQWEIQGTGKDKHRSMGGFRTKTEANKYLKRKLKKGKPKKGKPFL